MVKIFCLGWIMSVFFSSIPSSKPLSVIFNIILLSFFLFFFFSQKGGSTMGFLWILVYLGGMLIVFLYLLFMISGDSFLRETESSNSYVQIIFSLILLFLLVKSFFIQDFLGSSLSGVTSIEFQEFYSIILTISCLPIFSLFLFIITGSLFLYLGILSKKLFQSKISFMFLFIMKSMQNFQFWGHLKGKMAL